MSTKTDLEGSTVADEGLIKVSRSAAQWLYWFAGISIVNTLLQYCGVDFVFSFGFGFTELAYALGHRFGSVFLYAGSAICGGVFAALLLFGLFAAKQRTWAFIAGIVLVGFDLVLLVLLAGFEKFLSIAIHVCAVIALWRGMNATRLFKRGRQHRQAASY